MIKKILKFLFSKRGRIYTATLLSLLLLGNAYAKHKFHEKAVEELQTALKTDKVTDNEIFGSRHQYIAISQEEPTYYNSEDNVATEMIGRNHFVRYYDTMSSLHQAHLVVYDINKDFKKKIINLTPYLKKVKDFKEIKELAVSLRTIDGYDYVFLRNTRSDKQFAYNLDTNQFLTIDLPDYSYSKEEMLYFGDKSSARNQMNDSNMWGYLKREGNLDELLRKSPAPEDSYLSAQLNLIIEIDNVDISKEENQINLFNDNPEVKHIYEEAVNQTATNGNTLKKFKLLTRQGKEGDFPAGPTEPVKRKEPDKPSEPKKVPEFNVFPDSIFPVKTLSFSEILNKKAQQDYQKDYRAYEKARQKVQKDYDREYKAYKKKLAQYESYRDREYDKQSQIYFSPEEQTNDILHWLGTNGEQAIVISVEDGAGIRKEIHSFADIKEWVDKHDYDNTIKSDFRDYKEAK
ncbi:hypothetical protein [Streptococcus salivarius]|jgi:hypothetical protein|uniref:hypothetical protein n=1 Tax=Streptococcus salivarius TaxID=1304 RepID=UPI0009B7C8CC|nr:hypothetical protein [Streptococcus salivarius]ARC49663.1 hypothetical protein A6J87_09960 [Streptococcus salivarius]